MAPSQNLHRLLLPLLAAALLSPFGIATDADAQADSRVKTVVVGVSGRRGVDEGLAQAMSDVVQGVFAGDVTRLTLGREDIQRVLNFETERQALGCDSASCLSEIASALDVDRLITGSIDKVGSSYLVVLNEIDARTVEPIGRVQRTLPLDEDQLVVGVQEMAKELLAQAGRAPTRSDGPAGSLFIDTKPDGISVFIDGEEKGVTPVKVEALAPGTHKVKLQSEHFAPLEFDAPVFVDKVTTVSGGIGEKAAPTAASMEEYADKKFWNTITGWSRVGLGTVCGGCVAPSIAVGSFTSVGGTPGLLTAGICGGIVFAAGAGVCGWGAFDLVNPPPDPVSAATATNNITVVPPAGQGEAQTIEQNALIEMPH
jgi:hypothetical protein